MAEPIEKTDSLTALIERAHAALDVEDYPALTGLLERFDHEARRRAVAGPENDQAVWPEVTVAFAALRQRIEIGRDEASAALRSLHGSRNRANAYGRGPEHDE